MASLRIMNWLSDPVRGRVASTGTPAFAAMWALTIANEVQPLDLRFNQPGCGHLMLEYKLSESVTVTIITDLAHPETFNDDSAKIHVRALQDARENKSHQLRAAAAAKPEPGAKAN